MAIKVTRNDAGNCITFVGSTNPVYWNSCLEGEINEENSNNINVVNKIRTVEEGTDRKSTRLNSSHSQQSRMPSSA